MLGSGTAAGAFVAGLGVSGRARTVLAAAIGAFAVLLLVLLLGRWVRSVVALLIIGVMIGSASDRAGLAAAGLLRPGAHPEVRALGARAR